MKIAIIGAGAAGLMAAASVQHNGECEITILEKNEKAGKKLYITGKGRCNFTNDCSPQGFLQSVVTNPKFLYSALYGFSPQDAIDFIQKNGCPAKTERGGRVFPLSDKASDVTKALIAAAQKNGAQTKTNCNVRQITKAQEGFWITFETNHTPSNNTNNTNHTPSNNASYALSNNTKKENLSNCERELFDRVIIATGGKSYPSTGSTGDGYRFAKAFGHTIIEPRPSLTALSVTQSVDEICGLSLKNVEAQITLNKKKVRKEFGEMLFTHGGVSGPIILSLSGYFSKECLQGAELCINLKPALSLEMLDKRVLRDFNEFANKQLKNALDKLLPKSLISYIINYAGLDGNKPVNLISRAERARLLDALTCLRFAISGTGGFNEAIVTSGGVSVKEINPSTMESKIIKGLFFAGEVIDVDALTGGYNIQIAFSTARLAGKSATIDQ